MTNEPRAPYDFNKATLPDGDDHSNASVPRDKEQIQSMDLVAFVRDRKPLEGYPSYQDARFDNVVTARWHMGRSRSASVVYCTIWVRAKDGRWFSGTGNAGGWGYHKTSAAFGAAVRNAGIGLTVSPGGHGDRSVEVAMHAIAKAAGYHRTPMTLIRN